MKREKLNVRLPTDEGPNPYDSKTPPQELTPRWLWDWKLWVSALIFGIVLLAVSKARGLL